MAYSSIVKPSDYFNTKLYTGNGSTQSISSVGFQPDFTWIKNRDNTDNHVLYDAVRGATKRIQSNLTNAESTKTNGVTSFDSDGFSVGSANENNNNGQNIVSWNWLASNTTASNTDGSINSTVSVNTTSGFSIVKYVGNASAGATIGHGLGVVPKVMIVKNLSEAYNWAVYHIGLGSHTKYLYLDASNAVATDSGNFDNVPTSSTFLVGSNSTVNKNGNNYIAYCFAEKTGYSKFGSYTGNGNADGSFIYTGFKPALVITKCTSSTGNWKTSWSVGHLNGTGRNLAPNLSDSENTANKIDLLSNGFKIRAADTDRNLSGGTFIFMAFAAESLVSNSGTDGVPATAR